MRKTFLFNKVFVIESLLNEKNTGKELYDDLLRYKQFQIKNFKAEYLDINDKVEFYDSMNKIFLECENNGVYPMLHFEIHGSEDKSGLVLKNGELIIWKDIYYQLMKINLKVGNNLFLTLAVCHGAFLLEVVKIMNPAPFYGFIGSFEKIAVYDLMIRYNEFYKEFLDSFKLSKSIEKLEKANTGFPSSYKLIDTKDAFQEIYKNYLTQEFSEERKKQRFKDGIEDENINLKNRSERRSFEKKFIKKLDTTKKQKFLQARRSFFMLDKFPENKERFNFKIKL